MIFDRLSETCLPEIIKNKSDTSLRIWIAGCSTGQEAYSIAMCCNEYLTDRASNIQVQIFATDLSEKAITTARYGVYSKKETDGISEKRLHRFFDETNGHYHIKKIVRDVCVFAVHNFLNDPPFAKMDLISCRNVLVNFESAMQQKAFNIFHYSLNDNGFLWLGKTETISKSSERFIPFDKKEKLYSRKSGPARVKNIAGELNQNSFDDNSLFLQGIEAKAADYQKKATDILLSKYTPAGVVVNEQFDIVQFRGYTGEYLEPIPGKASMNIFKMTKDILAFEIRNALYKAKKTGEPFIKSDIAINAGKKIITIEVIPLLNAVDLHFLILFTEQAPPGKEQLLSSSRQKATNNKKAAVDFRILQLESELAQARADMQSITESQEDAYEEVQSSNEELMSNIEEYQSLHEELETNMEELQASNEELITTNQAIYNRNEELDQTRRFADSIISTLHEPLLVLDKKFVIKSANSAFYRTFHLTELATIGQVLFELHNNRWNIPGLKEILAKSGEKETMIDTIITFKFPSIGERIICFNIRPINTESGEPLVLLAMDDITARKNAERVLAEKAGWVLKEHQKLQGFLMESPALFAILKGPDYIFEFVNSRYSEFMGNRELIGKSIKEAIPELGSQGFFKLLENVYKTGKPFKAKEMPVHLNTGDVKTEHSFFDISYQAINDEDGHTEGILVFGYDVTEQVIARKYVEESEKRFSNILTQSLLAITILKGPEMIINFANDPALAAWGKGKGIIGQPLLKALPEINDQLFPELFRRVYETGVSSNSYEQKTILFHNGIPAESYYNFVCQPYTEADDTITGITVFASDVTLQVLAK
ncbi:MAG: CheR family methyltransferase, partial [Ferruginibacter sp.]